MPWHVRCHTKSSVVLLEFHWLLAPFRCAEKTHQNQMCLHFTTARNAHLHHRGDEDSRGHSNRRKNGGSSITCQPWTSKMQRRKGGSGSSSLMSLQHLKHAEHANHLESYKGRLVLLGDKVKDDNGNTSTSNERSASASQMAAAKFLDTI